MNIKKNVKNEIFRLKQQNVVQFSFQPKTRKHILRRHGDSFQELAKGQRAVTHTDLNFVPLIINEFDRTDLKREGIRFWKLINGFNYICVCTIKKDKLMVKTMYIKPQLKNFKKNAS